MRPLRIAFAVLLPSLPAVAFGAEGGHHDEHHGIPWATLVFSTINFGIFVFLIARYAWPSIRDWLLERHATIVRTLADAERAKSEAEQLKQEWERRLSGLQAEIEAMRQKASADIASERDQLLAAAQRSAESIRRDADRAAEQQVRAAHAQLRDEVARRALALANERARTALTSTDQDRFVADFLQQVRS
jgi:F-type H+-transporting ATPase subunit b